MSESINEEKFKFVLPEELQKALENGKKLEYITNNQRTALEKGAFYRRFAQEHGLILYSDYARLRNQINKLFKKERE